MKGGILENQKEVADQPNNHITHSPVLNGADTTRQIEISQCQFHQPLGAGESKDYEHSCLYSFVYFSRIQIKV